MSLDRAAFWSCSRKSLQSTASPLCLNYTISTICQIGTVKQYCNKGNDELIVLTCFEVRTNLRLILLKFSDVTCVTEWLKV